MSQQLDTLTDTVRRSTTVMESAVVLIREIKAKLDAAGTDPEKLSALSQDLDTGQMALAAAVVENTPADPAAA